MPFWKRSSRLSKSFDENQSSLMAPKKIVLAFDAYGTLLSTESIARQLASHFGEDKAKTIAATWRKYQLEYSWRATSMGIDCHSEPNIHATDHLNTGIYWDFSKLTRRSLNHALAESGVSLNDEDSEGVMKAYDSLSTFPDVQPMLDKLKDTKDIKRVIFSNGTHDMVYSSVRNSPDLSPHANIFDDIVSVDEVRKFKPAPETYRTYVNGQRGDLIHVQPCEVSSQSKTMLYRFRQLLTLLPTATRSPSEEGREGYKQERRNVRNLLGLRQPV